MKTINRKFSLEQDILKKYPGLYSYGKSKEKTFSVLLEDDALYVKPPYAKGSKIYPRTETLFFAETIDARINFNLNSSNLVESLTLALPNGAITLKKVV
ncbi:hypothetical protein ACFL7D_07480 [candidate division KSB1 bacterium]